MSAVSINPQKLVVVIPAERREGRTRDSRKTPVLKHYPKGSTLHAEGRPGAVRVFKTRVFARFVRKERICNEALCDAVARAERGLIDADLGGGVIKQRVARQGQGRSGGFRTLIAFKAAKRCVFLFGFAKSDMDNVDDRELENLKKAAKIYMALSESDLDVAVREKRLTEVECDGQEVQE